MENKNPVSSTWVKFGDGYKCGVCQYMPTFIDIRGVPVCPKCGMKMKYYETEDGQTRMVYEEDFLSEGGR